MEENKYLLAMMVAKRIKELKAGAKPLVQTKPMKPLTIALAEIKAGKVYLKKEEGPLKAEEIFNGDEKSEDVSNEVEKPAKPEDVSNEDEKPAKVKEIFKKGKKPAKSKKLSDEVKEPAKSEDVSDEVKKPVKVKKTFKKSKKHAKSED